MADVNSDVAGRVWKIIVPEGGMVAADEPVMILESMKMEIPAVSPIAGKVSRLLVAEEEMVGEDQLLAIVEPA
jgi:acetyl-CoA carboxylase biotin carboxyl carrier protein